MNKLEIEVDPDLTWEQNIAKVMLEIVFDEAYCQTETIRTYWGDAQKFMETVVENYATFCVTDCLNLGIKGKSLYKEAYEEERVEDAALSSLCAAVCTSLLTPDDKIKMKVEQILYMLNVKLVEKIKILLIN